MNPLYFFLIPLLLVGIVPFTFAEIEQGYNYDVVTNPDGSQTWKSHSPRLYNGNAWVDYIEASPHFIETANGKVRLNTDGSFTFYNNNNVELFTDRIVAKYADISNLGSWTYPATLNNAVSSNSFSNGQLTSSKTKSGVGLLEYKYIEDNGKWKTQLEATNLSGLTTKAFGFDEIIDLKRDTIKFGGITRNLDNFHGQTFDKTFLDNNEAKVLDLLNSVNFDFNIGYENLYSITIYDTGVNSSQLVFDFRTSDILLPNKKLIIDPTITNGGTGTPMNPGNTVSWTNGPITVGSPIWITKIGVNFSVNAGGNLKIGIYDNNAGAPNNLLGQQAFSIPAGTGVKTFTFTTAISSPGAFHVALIPDTSGHSWLGDATATERETSTTYGAQMKNPFVVTSLSGSMFWVEATYSLTRPAPAPDRINDLTLDSYTDTTANVSWTQPNLNGGNVTNYLLNYTTPYGNPLTFLANTTNTYYNATGLLEDTKYSLRVSVLTEGGYNATGNILNFTTFAYPDGIMTITAGNIGDTIALNGTATITDGTLPIELTGLNLYQDNILVKTVTISESVVAFPTVVNLDTVWYRITDGLEHEYFLELELENDFNPSVIGSATNATITREYNPLYLPAINNPTTQGNVNATTERFDSQDGIILKVNRISVSSGETWQIECIAQTNSQAASSKNGTYNGVWSNTTNTGYFNTTFTGFANSHAYITCFNDDLLFTLTSFTDSSLALLGIQLFDESYGSMIGVPVGVFFLVMTAGMATKRTAPTFIIVIAGIAGTMATIGFFSFEPIVWGLALVTAMLGIFVNQKIF